MHEHVESILYSEEQLRQRVRELGAQITADYAGKEPVLASVLRGSYIFMADLTRDPGHRPAGDGGLYGGVLLRSGHQELRPGGN